MASSRLLSLLAAGVVLFQFIVVNGDYYYDDYDEDEDIYSHLEKVNFISKPQEFEVAVGGNVTIPCEVDNLGFNVLMLKFSPFSSPEKPLLLYVGDVHILRNSNIHKIGNSFMVTDMQPKHEGKYQCVINTSELTHTVNISISPTVQRVTPAKMIVEEGFSVGMKCLVSTGTTTTLVRWRKLEGLLPSGKEYEHGNALELHEVSRGDRGTYTCEAVNEVGVSAPAYTDLEVEYPPKIVMEETKVPITEDGEVQFICTFDSTPDFTFKLFKDGKLLSSEKPSRSADFLYRKVWTIDEGQGGNYTCVVSNRLGETQHTMNIIERYIPGHRIPVQYRAAVLEMVPPAQRPLSPRENILENIRVMTGYALQAKQAGADIIVFPEQSLVSDAPTDRQRFRRYCIAVPDPDADDVICEEIRLDDDPVNRMSCAAKQLDMYMVFNVPEATECNPELDGECADGFYLYNTNLVFDRNGAIVSKYRKIHLNQEPQFDMGDNSHYSNLFTTDFGVTFGQHIGQDVMYYLPSVNSYENGVQDFVMPTKWIDALPFQTAPQIQYSWSRGLQVNLLAAGIHDPSHGSAGSGIYTGAEDISKSVYIYNDTQVSRLLITDIATRSNGISNYTMQRKPQLPGREARNPIPRPPARMPYDYIYLKESLPADYYSSELRNYGMPYMMSTEFVPLNPSSGEVVKLNLDYHIRGGAKYFAFVYSEVRENGNCPQHRQVTSVVYCPDGPESCGRYPFSRPTNVTIDHMNLTVTTDPKYLFPSVIDQNFQLVSEDHWSFTKSLGSHGKTTASIVISDPIDIFIYSVSIVGRWFEKDPECKRHSC